MKKFICLLFCCLLLFSGCAKELIVDGRHYESYGLFNSSAVQSPDIEYEASIGNLVWSIILFETIIMPVYFFGFSIMNPVRVKKK